MSSPMQIKDTAEFLFSLRKENKCVDDLPENLKPTDVESAYAIQDVLVQMLSEHHQATGIGYKIGCTSLGAQKLLNTNMPVYGQLLSSHQFSSPKTLQTNDYSMIVIEPEFGFQLAEDVPEGSYDSNSIQPFIKSVIPSVEVVHHRLGSMDKFNAPMTVADNAIHGSWIQGEGLLDWQTIDYVNHEVKLLVDEELTSIGKAEIALGSPLNVMAWLANTLPQYGHRLKKDDYVTTGVCMDVYTAKVGQHIVADFGSLGEVVIDLV